MNGDPIIELSKTSVYQNENLILANVSLAIHKGELLYLIGKTGSGKALPLLAAGSADAGPGPSVRGGQRAVGRARRFPGGRRRGRSGERSSRSTGISDRAGSRVRKRIPYGFRPAAPFDSWLRNGRSGRRMYT